MVEVNQQNLKLAMINNGATQASISKAAKIESARLSRLLKNGGKCYFDTARRLASALNVPPENIFWL